MAIRTFDKSPSIWKTFLDSSLFPVVVVVLALATFFVFMAHNIREEEKNPIRYEKIDGHEYVIYKCGFQCGITHSPRCECLTNSVSQF